MIKILALDVATTTGYAVMYNEDIMDYGLIQLQARVNAEIRAKTSNKDEQKLILKRLRYRQLSTRVKELISDYRPQFVVLEGVFHGHNVKTTAALNQYRGVVLQSIPLNTRCLSADVSNARSLVISDTFLVDKTYPNYASLKKYPKASSKKLKAFNWAVQSYDFTEFDYEKDNDITDAIVLAYWCYLLYNNNENL